MKSTAELHREFDDRRKSELYLCVNRIQHAVGEDPRERGVEILKDFLDRQRIADLKERIAEEEKLLHTDEELDAIQHNEQHPSVCLKCTYENENIAARKFLSRLRSDLSKLEENV